MFGFFIGTFLLGFIYVGLSVLITEAYRDVGYFEKMPWVAGFLTVPIITIIGFLTLLIIIFVWGIIVKGGILNV